jgi:peptide/nickel transport system substrate-binding protein/oligopeptide transport system substrate-binding protein
MRPGKKFTLGFLPSLFCLIALLVAGCGGAGTTSPTTIKPTPAPASQQVYRTGIVGSDIATFDPAVTTDANSAVPITAVFTGLVELNDKLEVVPELAASLPTISADGLTYTFTLRPGLKFSDGTPLTAKDVVYSIDRALSPAVSNLNGVTLVYLGLIKDADKRAGGKIPTLINDSLTAVDDATVKIVTAKKTAYFLQALTYPTAYIVEKTLIDKYGATAWTDHLNEGGGDGPWKVQSYSHTTGIVMVPNTNYWGKAQTLQRFEITFFKTSETWYQAYLAGQVDVTAIPAAHTAEAEAKTKEFSKNNQLSIFYIAMNYLYKPFDNIKIRQAFSLAINRDVIAKSIYKNLVIPSCHIVPNGMPGYDANLKCPGGAPTKGDNALAKQLFEQGLQEEGLTRATFPAISLTYPSGSASTADMLTTIRGWWSSVLGVNIAAHEEDFNQLLTDVNGTFCTQTDLTKCQNKGLSMWYLGWLADYPDPQDWMTLQFDKGAPNNSWNYGQNLSAVATAQQQVQTSLQQADVDLTANRLSQYNKAEESLVNDVAWMSLYQNIAARLRKPYVYGVQPNAQGQVPPGDWANIYMAAH